MPRARANRPDAPTLSPNRDEALLAYARSSFEVEDFHVVGVGEFQF
ncbi:hypothetical protein [Catellatospora citrea]|nr:hypothetical protein [Catellatospora citrea]